MQRLLVCVAALLVLHGCNFKGGGTWSDSAGNSGELKSKLTIKFEQGAMVYKLKFPNGTKEVFKLIFQSKDEESDADDKNYLLENNKGEVIGTGQEIDEKDEKITVLSFTIDNEKIELRLSSIPTKVTQPQSSELLGNFTITGKKTYRDGRVLTWSDTLTPDF